MGMENHPCEYHRGLGMATTPVGAVATPIRVRVQRQTRVSLG